MTFSVIVAELTKRGRVELFVRTLDKFYQEIVSSVIISIIIKVCVRYIFASLFFKSKIEHLWNLKKCYLFSFESSFRSRENQILEFKIFKFHDVIKCLIIKQIYFTE